jgi:hypothetical protein
MSVAVISIRQFTRGKSFVTFWLVQSLPTSITPIRTDHHVYDQKTYKESKNSRSNIAQSTWLIAFLIFSKGVLLRIAGHDERHGVGGMGSVRVSGLFVDHLLGVAVISSDQQDVSGLLASLVDRADGLVSSRDSLDRRI